MNGKFRRKKYNFSMVSNQALHDTNLSSKAKGVYAIIQSLITLDRDVYKWQIKDYCKEGNRSFDSSWNELKKLGYLKIYRMPVGKNNTFVYEYELLDEPDTTTESVTNVQIR